jgi:hypothetical protein
MVALAYARSELRFERVSWCGKTEFPIACAYWAPAPNANEGARNANDREVNARLGLRSFQ